MYSLYLYFLGSSLGNTSKPLVIFKDNKEVMLPYVTGFKDLVSPTSIKGKEYLHLS